jgi:hypothetical protein
MPLTSEAKAELSKTVRGLRAQLICALDTNLDQVYHLTVQAEKAGLREAESVRRGRFEAWLDERARTAGKPNSLPYREARQRFRRQAVQDAAATLLNRLVILRLMEAMELRRVKIVTGGWNSKGYKEFRCWGGPLLEDESEGYATLLDIVFDELAIDLPGLYGPIGVTPLIPVPVAALRHLVEALDAPALESAWTDDTTLGWIYQYWNDPERERLDAKIKDGGKIEPHEIAAKTQMFTERYMVEWLLQNSLGVTWLAICRKHGWNADAERVLPVLDVRRGEWRAKRDRGDVPLDALMPLFDPLEEQWKYYVRQEIPAEVVAAAPASLQDLKLLDPACGSGHFLVIACDLLFAFYHEEARHRGASWTDREIAEWILERNLHGIDIDPRAVQIAAAALYLKARTLAGEASPRVLNLVAPAFNLGTLPKDDPALKHLLHEVWRDTGLPESLTGEIVAALAGADYLGTLLKVEHAVSEAVLKHKIRAGDPNEPALKDYLLGRVRFGREMNPVEIILEKTEVFMAQHTSSADLGLRLDGEQLVSGVRFIRIARQGVYDVVIGNPPYQGAKRLVNRSYLQNTYEESKADLYAEFLVRSVELCRDKGLSALVAMRGWMFISQFSELRSFLLSKTAIVNVCDIDRGAFDEVPNEVLAAAMVIFRKGPASASYRFPVHQPTPLDDKSYDRERTARKRSAVLLQIGKYSCDIDIIKSTSSMPIVYWWSQDLVEQYSNATKLDEIARVTAGANASPHERFVFKWW